MHVSKFRKNLGFVLHAIFLAVLVSAIFWLARYRLLLVFVVLRVQHFILGGCIFTWIEYGTLKHEWIEYHYVKISKIPTKYFSLCVDRILPILFVILAYLLQK